MTKSLQQFAKLKNIIFRNPMLQVYCVTTTNALEKVSKNVVMQFLNVVILKASSAPKIIALILQRPINTVILTLQQILAQIILNVVQITMSQDSGT